MAVVEQIFPSLTWRIRQTVMYPGKELDLSKLADDFEGIHFGLYVNHQLTGVVSLFNEKDVYQFRKLAILPEAQKKGHGSQLLQHLIDFCKIQKASMLWCNARINAKEFYFKFGFHETEDRFFKNGHHYVIMAKNFNN
ncbi:GNAT family N-acetyltransferase [Pedobacter sp. MW01-1-1]|uniref:GNAT family N-acetyltransferase n=1 Tax=Pedobacter sp. MW01-1-1 TaxID=3383027 RepID=UPI003FEF1836